MHYCVKKKPTIGFGFCLSREGAQADFEKVCGKGSWEKALTDDSFYITWRQADLLFDNDFAKYSKIVDAQIKGPLAKDPRIKAIVYEISYQFGTASFPKFKAALGSGNWEEAIKQIRDNEMYKDFKERWANWRVWRFKDIVVEYLWNQGD